MPSVSAVGIDDDLAPGQPAVAHGAAHHKAAGRIDEIPGLIVEQLRRHDRPDHVLQKVAANLFQRGLRVVLSGNHDGIDPNRPVAVVFHRHLRFSIRTQIRQRSVFAHGGKLLCKAVRERDRQRHQGLRFIARITEHHALVAGADFIIFLGGAVSRLKGFADAHRDIGPSNP